MLRALLKAKKDMASRRSRIFSITNQLRYGLALLVALCVLLTAGGLIYLSIQAQEHQLEIVQQERSQAAADEINDYLDDLARKLSYLARVQGLTDLPPDTQKKFLAALIRHNSAYERVAILDNNGFVVSSISSYDQAPLANQIAYTAFLAAFKQQEDFVSFVEIDQNTKLPFVTLAVPIRNQKDEVAGVLLAQINLKFLWFFVSKSEVGKTGYAYIIDNRNFLIAEQGSKAENFNLRDISNLPFIQKLTKLHSANELKIYQGLRGVEVVGAIAPIRSMHWKVIVELPTTEAYAPLRSMLFVMGSAVLLATILATGLGVYFARQIVSPLQRLTQAAAQISAGNLDVQVRVNRPYELRVLARTFNEMTTQLHELIQELRKERNFVSVVLDTTSALVFVLDDQGRIIRFNRACEQLTGYAANEVKGKYFWDLFVPPEEVPTVKALFGGLSPDLLSNQYERYWVTRDGSRRLIAWSSTTLVDGNGTLKYLVGTGIDITQRQQAEQERKLSEAQLLASARRDRLLAEIALRIRRSLNLNEILDTAVTEVRQFLQADRVYVSQFAALSQQGTSGFGSKIVAESVATPWHSIRSWMVDDIHFSEVKTFFEQGSIGVVEDTDQLKVSSAVTEFYSKYQVRASLAVPIILGNELYGVLVANQCSGPRHWEAFEIQLLEQLATQVAIAIQQAELYQQVQALNTNLERQVEERTQELQQKMQELQALYQVKNVFLHAFSHDLRTPTVGTSLVLKNLLNNPAEPVPVSRSLVERMIQSSDRQLNLIDSLLEAHATETQGIVLHCQPVNLNQLVKAIVEDLEALVAQSEAILTNLMAADLPIVSADPTQLRRVFVNLLNNALKYNPPKVNITINAKTEVGMIRCSVEDNGVGISQEQCDHLFELYARGTNTRSSTSLGLGLYLCRQIVIAHGGEIGVNSRLGAGATFWFTLPLAKD